MINIIKIYFWQFISILFNFASIFVVTPFLASNHPLYGIYTLVSSANVFLAYADFGFLGAGMKFAAECYAQKDLKQEVRIIGFTAFVFSVFVFLFAACILYVSFRPEILIKQLYTAEQYQISRQLLLIFAVSAPVFMLQRILQIIFAIRLQDYIFQKVLICANAIKILSAFVLFSHGHYPIVTYFLFSQICSLIAIIVGFGIARRNLKYDLIFLMKSFRFDKNLYNKTKALAFVSIFLTICWVTFYELDPFVISKLLGPSYLAIYAIGFSLMEYFRSIFGIIFSPFIAKFNHYMGLKDFIGLNEIFKKVLVITLPLVVFPILSISITIPNFILTWVGVQYAGSIPIARILVLGYLFNFITSPTGILIMAYQKTKMLYYTNSLLPVIYWLGILFTFKYLQLQAFADFKFVAFLIITITYMNIIVRILNIKFWEFMGALLLPALIPVITLLIIVFFTKSYLPVQKGSFGLFVYFIYNGIVISIAIIIYYFSSKIFKDGVNSIISTVFSRYSSRKLKNFTI